MKPEPMSAEELAELKDFVSDLTGHLNPGVARVALHILRAVTTIEARDAEIARLRAALMDSAARPGKIRVDNPVDYGARKRLDPVIEGIEAALGGVE